MDSPRDGYEYHQDAGTRFRNGHYPDQHLISMADDAHEDHFGEWAESPPRRQSKTMVVSLFE
jgi:hypothetical protein